MNLVRAFIFGTMADVRQPLQSLLFICTAVKLWFCFVAAEQNSTDSDRRKVHRKSAGFIIGEGPGMIVLCYMSFCMEHCSSIFYAFFV